MNKKEKSDRYDVLECIKLVEKCPHCQNDIEIGLTDFKSVSFNYGLVWTCPHCSLDFHIKKIELE